MTLLVFCVVCVSILKKLLYYKYLINVKKTKKHEFENGSVKSKESYNEN